MAEIREYIKENLALSFASWSHGQKVGSLTGLLVAAAIGLGGWAGMAIVQPALEHYWPYALVVFFMTLILVVTPFRLWERERGRAKAAEAKLMPRLKCSFDRSSGCQHQTKYKIRNADTGERLASTKIRIFRVRLDTEVPGGLRNCRATLLWLKRDNRLLFDHAALPLTIAPAERPEPFAKDVRDKVPEYVDLFCLTEDNRVNIYPPLRSFPISIQPHTLFTGPGEYRFHVVVSAENSASAEIDVVLKWTGDWQAAEAYAG